MQQFNFPFCEEYSHSLEFKTSVVRRFDGSEQRQALWLCPKRSFNLNFEANNEQRVLLEQFFRQQKGDGEAFYWSWGESYFGSNLDYTCFLDSSKFSQSVYQFSYSKIPMSLVTIDDNNILKGRFFLNHNLWSVQGDILISSKEARYQGVSSLFQSDILTPGKNYRLKIKTADIQGLPPVLSNQTALASELESSFFEGDKTLNFTALGPNLIFEMAANSSGSFCEVALFQLADIQTEFDFQANIEHQSELIFSNLKDEIFTFKNSRENTVQNPIRRWVFTFEFTPSEAKRFEAFFISKKGRYKAFEWVYNDENFLVRFDSDKLDQKQYQLGYREVKIPIIEVLQ
ncbi:MAG: DUF2460 domain-containing protein [bacterium]